jgi:hypothetical protein
MNDIDSDFDENFISKLLQFLFYNQSAEPPENPEKNSLYMDLDGDIFIYFDEKWEKIEGITDENPSLNIQAKSP